MTKNKNKKKRGRWDNLKKDKNLKLRRDYIDTHYINGVESILEDGSIGIRALTPQEKDELNRFYGEYLNASVNHDSYDEQMHDTEELVKDCYDRNNARNRCLLNKGKAMNTVKLRSWGELDQDTIHDDYSFTEDMYEELEYKMCDYNEKSKMYKKVNKAFPELFTFDEFMQYDIEMIFEKIKTFI